MWQLGQRQRMQRREWQQQGRWQVPLQAGAVGRQQHRLRLEGLR
jgi:hypothetical protein